MDSNSSTLADKIITLIQEEKPSSKITFLKERDSSNSRNLLRVNVDDQKLMMKWTDEAEETMTFHAVNMEDAIVEILEKEIKKAEGEAEQKRRDYFFKMDEINYERDNIYEMLRVNQDFLEGFNGPITDEFGDEVIKQSNDMFDRLRVLFDIEMGLADSIGRERMLDHMQSYIDSRVVKGLKCAIKLYLEMREKKKDIAERVKKIGDIISKSIANNRLNLASNDVQTIPKEL